MNPGRMPVQRGFSLVELLIAMTLGLLVVATVGQIFLASRQSFRTQSGVGTLQENGRFALMLLRNGIHYAGFPRTIGPSSAQPVAAAFVVGAAATVDGSGSAPDSIMVQYNSDPDVPGSDRDCLGRFSDTLASGSCVDGTNPEDPATNRAQSCSWTVVNRFFIQDDALRCDGNGGDGLGPPNTGNSEQLVTGVENMQIQYGEDIDLDTFADIYRNAANVANWNNVVTVRISLLINSGEAVSEIEDTQQYPLLDISVTPASDLQFSRRVFTTTIELRNKTI